MVIVKDISRLTRNKNKTGWYTEIFFPDNDVRFISVTEFIDSGEKYEIDDTIMLRGIANQYYIADISKKIRANKRVMKEKGQFVENSVPYGYKKSNEDKHKIIIDEEVGDNIRKIYDMYIEGESCSKIAEYLNKNKIKSPSQYMKMKNAGKKWRTEQINNILSNPFYIGNTVINKYETNYITKTCRKNNKKNTWIIKENTHQPIIKKSKYNKVQEIKQRKKGSKAVKHEYLLRDLLYCGHCKRKMQYKIYKSHDKKTFLYNSIGFNCSYLYKKECKNKTYIKEKDLNEIIKNEVIKRLKLIKINDFTNKLLNYYKNNDENIKKIIIYKNEIKKLERKKSILYKNKCEEYISINEYKEQYQTVKEEIKKYDSLIKQLEKKGNKLSEEQLKEIIEKIQKGDYINNNFLKEIIEKIEIYSKDKIEIFFNL